MNDYYVYALFRENGDPFYVGMGRGDRWLHHEKHCHRRNTHKDNIIKKIKATGAAVAKEASYISTAPSSVLAQILGL